MTYLPPALLPPEALPAELAAVRATAAAAALRPPMSTGLNTEVFRLAAPRGLELKLAAAACTAALRPSGKAEAPMDVEAEAVEDTGEPLSMPTDRPPSSKMHKMLTEEKIDLIVVLTESGYHCKHVLEIAKYSKSIIVEKPISLTIEDGLKMRNECEKFNSRLFPLLFKS